MADKKNYGSIRVKNETFEGLKQVQDAFELLCDRRFTMDEVLAELLSGIEKADENVWRIMEAQKEQKKALAEMVGKTKN